MQRCECARNVPAQIQAAPLWSEQVELGASPPQTATILAAIIPCRPRPQRRSSTVQSLAQHHRMPLQVHRPRFRSRSSIGTQKPPIWWFPGAPREHNLNQKSRHAQSKKRKTKRGTHLAQPTKGAKHSKKLSPIFPFPLCRAFGARVGSRDSHRGHPKHLCQGYDTPGISRH
jgi:hypothetical protein